LGWTNAGSYGSSEVCGESDLGLGGCSGFVTWAKAEEFCTNAGARLCSANELASDEARATGCTHDRKHVWSNSECGDGSYLTVYGASFGGTDTVCEEATSASISARCCADVLSAPSTPSQAPVISPSSSTCEDLGWTNAVEYGSSSVCGESDFGLGSCSGFLTHSEAIQFCESPGARLCTAAELQVCTSTKYKIKIVEVAVLFSIMIFFVYIQADEARGTGCSGDNVRVRSSDECTGGHMVTIGSSRDSSASCRPDESSFLVRCCANAESSRRLTPGISFASKSKHLRGTVVSI